MKKLTTALGDGTLTISALAEGIYRVVLRRCRIQRESMLTRYGIVRADLGDVDAREENGALIVGETSARLNGTAVEFTARGYTLALDLSETLGEDYDFEGFSVRTPLEDGERLFGLGDESRERPYRRSLAGQRELLRPHPLRHEQPRLEHDVQHHVPPSL